MRRSLVALFAIFIAMQAICQTDETIRIMRLSSPTIKIGGKVYKEGQVFPSGANIQWTEQEQSMDCKGVTTGTPYRFTRRQFESKGAILSVKDYLLRINQASTRDALFQPVFSVGKSKASFPEKRCALVIGNSIYDNLPFLANPVKDAADIRGSLLNLGFDVMDAYDCNYADMKTMLNVFTSKAKNYDAAVIYYSGHGVQEAGNNYLIPVDCPLESRADLNKCVSALEVVEKLENTGCETKIIFLDACRNVKTTWLRSAQQGLASMEGYPGMVIAFSTRTGRTANDGTGDNSPFAKAFLDNVADNTSFSEMMANVARQTYTTTEDKQFPVTIGSLMTDFRFNPSGEKGQTIVIKTVTEKAAPVSVPVAPEKPAPPATKVMFDEPGFTFSVKKVERAGRNVYISIEVDNQSGRNVKPLLIARESTKHPSDGYECAAYLDSGGSIDMYSARMLVLEGSDRRGDSQYIASWPSGVKSVFKVYLSDVSPDATAVNVLRMSFRQVSQGAVYGIALLEIRNIPLP